MESKYIAAYYQESDPDKRRKYLKKSISLGEEPEANAIRMEIWESRYQGKSSAPGVERADAYLGLWMMMEYSKNAISGFFGPKSVKRDINKQLAKIKCHEIAAKSALHEELIQLEWNHAVATYVDLSLKDRNYNTYMFGLVKMKESSSRAKLEKDVVETGLEMAEKLKMEEELKYVVNAARHIYESVFKADADDIEDDSDPDLEDIDL